MIYLVQLSIVFIFVYLSEEGLGAFQNANFVLLCLCRV